MKHHAQSHATTILRKAHQRVGITGAAHENRSKSRCICVEHMSANQRLPAAMRHNRTSTGTTRSRGELEQQTVGSLSTVWRDT